MTTLAELPPVNTLGYTVQTWGQASGSFWNSMEIDETPELYQPRATFRV